MPLTFLPRLLSIALLASTALFSLAESEGDRFVQVQREAFDFDLPAGWVRVANGQTHTVHVSAADVGLQSCAGPDGSFGEVAVEGKFAFQGSDGAGQLIVRQSAAGSYVAELDAAGGVTLEKRDAAGAIISNWSANAELQTVTSAARTLWISAVGGMLRVTVDEIDVLTVVDAAPLPTGGVGIGAEFHTSAGNLKLNDFTVWSVAAPMLAAAGPETSSPAATNDEYVNRHVVSTARYRHLANNAACAANEPGEPVPACAASMAKTVWYEFQPPASRTYLISTFGSSFNTALAVYTGTWGAFTPVGCSDDVTGSQQARLTLALEMGQTYSIQVGGSGGGEGDFEFYIMDPADALVPSTPTISNSATGAPSTPVLNNGRTNLFQPVLAWAPRPTVTPYGYAIQVSTLANFSSTVAADVILEPQRFWEISPALGMPAQPAGQKYFWRAAAVNYQGQTSAFSPAYTFTLDRSPPQPPVLLTPALNGVATTYRPVLKWKAVSDAKAYLARIATNFSASTIYGSNNVIVTGTSYTPAADIPQGEYWYAVESRDAAGNWGGFGEKRRFVVNLSLTPANGTRIIAKAPSFTSDVVFTWAKVPGAEYYVEIATDSSFTDTVVHGPFTNNKLTVTGLGIGTRYWRVRVNGAELPMSLARHFHVTPALPVAPLIQTVGPRPDAVKNKGSTNDTTPVFDWTKPANWVTPPLGSSIYYELQVATDSGFTQLVAPSVTGIWDTDLEWPATTLAPGTYFWRVRAITNLGLAGAYSAAYRFTVDTTPPLPPNLLTPALNGVAATYRPVLKWKAVSDATAYRARIATNFSASTIFGSNDVIVTGTSYTPSEDVPQGEYWYAVESRDAAGNWSGFGEKRRFVVNLSLTPANGANLIVKAPVLTTNVVLTWAKVPGAEYHIEIASDSSFTDTVEHGPFNTTKHTLTGQPIGHWFWRVRVNGINMPQSLARNFYVTPALPVAPLIQTPGGVADGGTTNDVTPLLDWTVPTNWVTPPLGSSITYALELSTNSAFTQLVAPAVTGITSSDFEWTPTNLAPGTTYYWRVRARTNLGLLGPFSKTYRFTVE